MRCMYIAMDSSNGEINDLGLHAEMTAWAIAMHRLFTTLALLPFGSNNLFKKSASDSGIIVEHFQCHSKLDIH